MTTKDNVKKQATTRSTTNQKLVVLTVLILSLVDLLGELDFFKAKRVERRSCDSGHADMCVCVWCVCVCV